MKPAPYLVYKQIDGEFWVSMEDMRREVECARTSASANAALRDQFAMAALHSLSATGNSRDIARAAYILADNMMVERTKEPT